MADNKTKTYHELNAERGINVVKEEYQPLVERLETLFKQGE